MKFNIQMFADGDTSTKLYDLDDALKVEHGAKFAERTGYLLNKKLGVVEDAQEGNVATLSVDGNVVGSKHGIATTDEFMAMLDEYLPIKNAESPLPPLTYSIQSDKLFNAGTTDGLFEAEKGSDLYADCDTSVEYELTANNLNIKVNGYDEEDGETQRNQDYSKTRDIYLYEFVVYNPVDSSTQKFGAIKESEIYAAYADNSSDTWSNSVWTSLAESMSSNLSDAHISASFDSATRTLSLSRTDEGNTLWLMMDYKSNERGRVFYNEINGVKIWKASSALIKNTDKTDLFAQAPEGISLVTDSDDLTIDGVVGWGNSLHHILIKVTRQF